MYGMNIYIKYIYSHTYLRYNYNRCLRSDLFLLGILPILIPMQLLQWELYVSDNDKTGHLKNRCVAVKLKELFEFPLGFGLCREGG